jgi:invasion protein IalB
VNGCFAEYPISEAEIAGLSKGANLTLAIQTLDDAPISFNVSGAGFAAAYAKVKGQ